MIEVQNNFLSHYQLKIIWDEINIIKPLILENTISGEAINKKKGYGRLFDSFMARNIIPNIFNIKGDLNTSVLVNYFEDGGYYKQHVDDCDETSILMLSLDNNFSGGDLIFETLNLTCKFENNKMIAFSKLPHEVSEIKYHSNSQGRFSINYFKKGNSL